MKSGLRHVCLMLLVFMFFSGTALAADYVVSDAPNPDANGLYVQNGTSDAVPMYTKGSWSLAREQIMGPAWIIRNGPDIMNDIVYWNWTSPSPDLPPNDGNWQHISSPVLLPLTITLAPAQNIPSMGTWGILIMTTLLAGIAIAVIRKGHFPDTGARA